MSPTDYTSMLNLLGEHIGPAEVLSFQVFHSCDSPVDFRSVYRESLLGALYPERLSLVPVTELDKYRVDQEVTTRLVVNGMANCRPTS